jgi:hypothetical protein
MRDTRGGGARAVEPKSSLDGEKGGGGAAVLWQVCIQNGFKCAGGVVIFGTENWHHLTGIISVAQPFSERLSQPQKVDGCEMAQTSLWVDD